MCFFSIYAFLRRRSPQNTPQLTWESVGDFILNVGNYVFPGVYLMSIMPDLIKRGESSPYYSLLNIKIDEVKDKYARLPMNLEEKHLQFLKTVHGGAIGSLADSAAAWATIGSAGENAVPVTVEMKINFLAPVKSGLLTAEARIVHKGFKITVSDVEVKDDTGNLVAKSLVTYYLRSSQS